VSETTTDALLGGRLELRQPRRGARVTMDSLLLVDFVRPARGAVLDLGCGTGAIAIALALLEPKVRAVGLELDEELAALARENAAANRVSVEIHAGDLRRPPDLGPFALVVANPPYFADSGRGERTRANARQERTAKLADVVAAARRFTRGRFALIYPAERVAEILALLGKGLAPRRLRFVHSVAGEPANRVLVEAHTSYRGGVSVLPPLIVHMDDRRTYTPEAAKILGR